MNRWVANNREDALRLAPCVDSSNLVIMSYNIHNPSVTAKVSFRLELWNGTDFMATIINTEIDPNDTLFFDTKLILIQGDYIKVTSDKELHIIISGT